MEDSPPEDHNWSEAVDIGEAPDPVQALLDYWKSKCPDGGFPAKADIQPWEISRFLGRICILEITSDPMDFIYRLDGTNIASATNENLTGQSILNAEPTDFARSAFNDLKATVDRAEPTLWLVRMRAGNRKYDYLRLVLPLVGTQGQFNYLLTYSHRFGARDGNFPDYDLN